MTILISIVFHSTQLPFLGITSYILTSTSQNQAREICGMTTNISYLHAALTEGMWKQANRPGGERLQEQSIIERKGLELVFVRLVLVVN